MEWPAGRALAEGLPSGKARTGHWEGQEEGRARGAAGVVGSVASGKHGAQGGREWGRSMESEAQSSGPLSSRKKDRPHPEKLHRGSPLSCPRTLPHEVAPPGGRCPYHLSPLQCFLCKPRALGSPLPPIPPSLKIMQPRKGHSQLSHASVVTFLLCTAFCFPRS